MDTGFLRDRLERSGHEIGEASGQHARALDDLRSEEDHQRRQAVEMRNEADALAFRTEKLLADNAETITEDVKTPVVEALEVLKEALKTDDNDAVKAAMDDLNTKAGAMGQAMYAAAQAKQESEAAQAGDAQAPADDDDVVDAEIVDEDAKDDK